MAAHFGDFVPISSRAVDEDDDDEEDDDELFENKYYCDPEIIWSTGFEREQNPNSNKSCSHLIVAIGPVATGFAFTYILPATTDVIAVIKCGSKMKDLSPFQQSLTDKSCVIHRIPDKPHVWVLQCNVTVLPEQAFSLTQQLLSVISLDSQIVILATSYLSDYKSSTPTVNMEIPLMRKLFTPKFKNLPDFPLLEQPNTVSGLPAAILAQCQVQGRSAVLYQCYSDSIFVHIPTIKSFLPVLKTGPLASVVAIKPDAENVLRRLIDLYADQDCLYT